MKKYVKIICIIIVIILFALILNTLRNYLLINNLLLSGRNYIENLNNYYVLEEVSTTINNSKSYSKVEQYYKDGIYLTKCYQDNELNNINWMNKVTNEKVDFDVNNAERYFPIKDDFNILFMLEEFNISQYIFNFLKSQDNLYRICLGNKSYIYYNKDTGICEKYEFFSELPVTITYTIIENCVTDADIEKPEI